MIAAPAPREALARAPAAAVHSGMLSSRSLRRGRGAVLATCVALALAAGCTGTIGDPAEDLSAGPTGTPPRDALVASTRFPRLTHRQWENTVRDLLKLGATPGVSSAFTTDPPGSTFGNDGELLKVTPGLWGDYQKATELVAEKLAKDPAALARVVPVGLSGALDAKARAFVEGFAWRAYRRPLSAEETAALVELFKRGASLTGLADPVTAGVQVVVTAVLQSPYFEYRVELGERQPDGTLGLGPYEMASRLSYALWNTMPDDALFAAARDGTLATAAGIEVQARRLLDDPRAEPVLADFHARLFDFDHFASLKKDPAVFPQWPATGMDAALRTEAELFVREVTVARRGGIAELLTASYTFVNDKLAPLYGVDGAFDASFRKVELDPKVRAGLLTQIGFLAANASPRETDPIHRGVFVNLRIVCADLPPPPMNVPPLPKDAGGTMTMRERITAHTGKNTCGAGCHGSMINPAGFAFEGFDAIGRARATDNGRPVNAADVYPFLDGPKAYDGAAAFAQVLAKRPQVHRCYAGNWLEYAYGRRKASGDEALIERVAGASLAGASTKELLLKLVLERSFAARPGGS